MIFAHWSNLSIFEQLSTESDFAELSIDSTYRGGTTSKIHIAVDELGRPRKIILTAGTIVILLANCLMALICKAK